LDVPGLDFWAVDDPLGALRIVYTGKYPIDYRKELRAWHTGFTGEEDRLTPIRREEKAYSGGRQAVIFHYEYGNSRFVQEFLMEPDVPFVEVTLSGEWKEVEKYLKIQFGVSGTGDQAAFADLAYGFTETLPEDMEYPMQYFCGVRDESKALLVLNRSRYGCRWKDRRLSISAIRCATYPAPISDRGPFSMSYRIAAAVTADSAWRRETFAQGFGFNRRFLSYAPSWSSNGRPTDWSLLQDEPELALGTTLKPADDGSGLIIRTFNPGTVPIRDRLIPAAERRLWEESTYLENATRERREVSEPLEWRPWEIKTLSVDVI
jgi:alpha-mannosidase